MFKTLIAVLNYAEENNWSEAMLSMVLNSWPDANQVYLNLISN